MRDNHTMALELIARLLLGNGTGGRMDH